MQPTPNLIHRLRPAPRHAARRWGVALTVLLLVGACGQDDVPINHPIVFVRQNPVFAPDSSGGPGCADCNSLAGAIYSTFSNFSSSKPEIFQPARSVLVRLDPNGNETILSPRRGVGVRDPEVSWDAHRILFSMKIGTRGLWQIYEVEADGDNLRRISRDDRYNDIEPAYLPDGRIVFLSDRARLVDPGFLLPSANLHVMAADGSSVRALSIEPGGEFNPTVSSDGRILFTRWHITYSLVLTAGPENTELLPPFPLLDRFLVWKTAADGTSNAHPVFGEHTIHDHTGGYVHPRELPDGSGRLVATLANTYGTFGAGTIVRLDPAQHAGIQEPELLTPLVHNRFENDVNGRYRDPYPLQDGRILAVYSSGPVLEEQFFFIDGLGEKHPAPGRERPVSRIPEPRPHFKLVLLPEDRVSEPEVLVEDDDWLLWPVELAPRTVPALDAGTGRTEFDYGILNSKDVFLRDRNHGQVVNGDAQPIPAPGEVTAVRIFGIEFVPFPFPLGITLRLPQRFELGRAPVEPDGSFAAVVPAGVPLFWQSERPDGTLVVRDPFLTQLQRGQVITCNGCHTPHDGRIGRQTNRALEHPVNLTSLNVDLDGNGVVDLLE